LAPGSTQISQPVNRLPQTRPSPSSPPRPTSGPTRIPVGFGSSYDPQRASGEVALQQLIRDQADRIGLANDPVYQDQQRAIAEDRRAHSELEKTPEYRRVAAEPGFKTPDREAEDYGLPTSAWIGLTPEKRKQYRDESWQKDPFNIFGDKWSWAPWNQTKKNQTTDNDFPGPTETVPFSYPPGTQPFFFTVRVSSQLSIYGTPSGRTSAIYQRAEAFSGDGSFYGVPEYLRVE
jgi:hypothetical protein